jgi:cell division protein FtsB
MRKIILKSLYKFQVNIKRIKFEGIGFTIILGMILLILTANIVRVFSEGNSNYTVYGEEQAALEKLRDRNETLKSEVLGLQSVEEKSLLAREVLEYARPGEQLYRTKELYQFAQEQKAYFELKTVKDYSGWWLMILR